MKKIIWMICITFFILLTSQSCSLFDEMLGVDEEDNEIAIETEKKEGSLEIGEDFGLDFGDIQVITLTEIGELKQDSTFEVDGNISDKYQIVIFKKPQSELPIFIGIYDPESGTVSAGARTTALALTLLNPYLVYTSQSQRIEYLNAVESHASFSDLISLLNEAYRQDPENVLNYETNPKIYQLTVEIMKGVMENLGNISNNNDEDQVLDPPYIQDINGAAIQFINPRRIYYTAGINSNGGALEDIISIEKSSPITSFSWGWPPNFTSDATQTDFDLGNGNFEINITKGVDFEKIGDWDDPIGRATRENTAQAILYFMDLFTGYNLSMEQEDLDISVASETALSMQSNINEKNTEEFIYHFCNLMYNNSNNISSWLLGGRNEAAEEFIKAYTRVLKNAVFVFKLMGFVNQNGPFYWEFVNSPGEVIYNLTQSNGEITAQQKNNAPDAQFTINPPAGIIGTSFTFDATGSTDDLDEQTNLQYRWDFESDGNWDSNWSSSPTVNKTYSEAGSYLVTLQVMDSAKLIGTITHKVNVGGGAGTANHVKLFQDDLPWNSNAMLTMLVNLGFTEGAGANQYEVVSSSEMATVSLTPGTDLVIIANDQNNIFYENYAANQVRFNNFVYMGGSLFWEACDQGWAMGSMESSGVVLPGNIETNYNYDNYNYITDQNLPLVSGLPDEMDHNYASHESFTNLPDGTTIYCTDSNQQPTLIEYNLGGGWIIMTGQPLEHQYDNIYGNSDMEELLPRIVSYFTGKELSKPLAKPGRTPNPKPSSHK